MRWLVFLCACSAGVEVDRAAIIGGARDTGDPAVVMLVSYPADQSTFYTCTASLIAPALLLTAAHCVDAPNHPGYSFGAFPGDDASTYPTAAQIAAQLVPASSVIPHPQYDPNPPFLADLALVQLQHPIAAAPLPLSSSPPVVSSAARIVGYGQTSYGTLNAAKYAADTTVASVPGDDTVLVGDAQRRSCVGDSGGPALVGGVVVGVDSYTDTVGCTQAAHYRRVDLYRAFIDPYLPQLDMAAPPDLAQPKDLAQPRDLGSSKDLAPIDLASDPDLATAKSEMSGGCQEAPGPISPGALLLTMFWLRLWGRRRSRRPAR